MSNSESNHLNGWNSHHAYIARPLSDSGDAGENPVDGTSVRQHTVSNRNVQGHLRDRATRLLTVKLTGSPRRIRG